MKKTAFNSPMYFGAGSHIFGISKNLKKTETVTEKLLWEQLRNNQMLNLHFRRQYPINSFIADFYCHKIKLIVEVDGNIHNMPENIKYDAIRTDLLNKLGIHVIRFTNHQVINDIENVISVIKEYANKLKSP